MLHKSNKYYINDFIILLIMRENYINDLGFY